jgi:glycosyltransferase involved in cell wall biosynthesis
MRIGMIAPLELRVPPVGYGGTELLVSLLTEELVRLGHDVTLYASGDSVTGARLVSCCSTFLRGSTKDKWVYNLRNVAACLEKSENFDIIHNHTFTEGLSMAGLSKTPVLTTLHGILEPDWEELFLAYKGWYNTISFSAKTFLPEKDRFAGVIYNAIDVDSYPFKATAKQDYMLFLSRISHEKGPDIAIEVAKRMGRKLIIAGNIDTKDVPFWEEEIKPKIDNELIFFAGEADYKKKRELMSGAYCLLAPITWNEPFGLFMVEAMACGTPVIVFNRGSAPEIVIDGVTGYVVDTIDDMIKAVENAGNIDRARCRRHVKFNFDVQRLGQAYLDAYRMILEETHGDGNKGSMETSTRYL